jgi:hypothetical protein
MGTWIYENVFTPNKTGIDILQMNAWKQPKLVFEHTYRGSQLKLLQMKLHYKIFKSLINLAWIPVLSVAHCSSYVPQQAILRQKHHQFSFKTKDMV